MGWKSCIKLQQTPNGTYPNQPVYEGDLFIFVFWGSWGVFPKSVRIFLEKGLDDCWRSTLGACFKPVEPQQDWSVFIKYWAFWGVLTCSKPNSLLQKFGATTTILSPLGSNHHLDTHVSVVTSRNDRHSSAAKIRSFGWKVLFAMTAKPWKPWDNLFSMYMLGMATSQDSSPHQVLFCFW